jgi:THO complex subunit 1
MDFFAQKTQLLACLRSCIAASGAAEEGGDDPALAEVRALVESAEFHGGKPDEVRAVLEHCLCQVVDDTLESEDANVQLQRALDLTVLFAAKGLVDLPCPLNILNDVLGSQTIEECSVTFAYLESKKAFLYEQGFFAEHKKKNAKVALLRLCNAMVKRLSKSNDTVFRGRILMFLATVLSISDRSGVGLRGQFNTGNVTEYDEEGTEIPDAGADAAVDIEFYKAFWGLQKLFIQRELIHKPEHWKQLVEGVPLLFSAFASQGQLDDVEGGDEGKKKEKTKKGKRDRGSKGSSPRSSSGAAAGATATTTEPAAAAKISNESYFAKFLTSSHLMSLELRDPHFRRHILVQVTPTTHVRTHVFMLLTSIRPCSRAIAAADFLPVSAESPWSR